MGHFDRLRRGSGSKRTSNLRASQSRVRKNLHVERLEQRLLLAADIDLADLLPANGGDGSVGITLFGVDFNDRSGISVSSAGDVNGDGFDDIVIGADRADGAGNLESSAGESYVVFGQADFSGTPTIDLATLNGTTGFTLFGVDAGDASGLSVSSAGDVNGDGFDDIVIGAYRADGTNNLESQNGESYVVFGQADFSGTPTIDLSTLNGTTGFTLFGLDSNDRSGYSVSGAGDVNGDGFDDLLIGADGTDGAGNLESSAGESYVIFGKADFSGTPTIDLATLNGTTGFTLLGVDEFDSSGFSVSGAGDVNSDGFDDIVIGAYRADGANNLELQSGESYVVFGQADFSGTPSIDLTTLNGTTGFTLFGVDSDDRSGWTVSGAGDVNGDGFNDLLISTPIADGVGNLALSTGESYVVFGKADFSGSPTIDLATLNGTTGFTLFGLDSNDRSGQSVSGAGDVNGDGFDDLLIGADGADGAGNLESEAGESYVIFGKFDFSGTPTIDLSTLNGTTGFTLYGVDSSDLSGVSVNGAGDVNGDGFDDLLIGASNSRGASNLELAAGETYVIFGGNLTSSVSQNGSSGPDTLTGSAAVDILVGGRDDDTLVGNGGADVLRGGEGDDILAVGDLTFSRIVGGSGTDTLRLDTSSATLDLTTLADNRILDVEQIDITGLSPNTLTLDVQEVLNISSHSNTLVVLGDSDDTVNIDLGWIGAGVETIGLDDYRVLTQGNATLKIDTDIDITIPIALVVDSTSDVLDGDYNSGELSLREALGIADYLPGANTITFSAALSGQTITLGGSEIEFTDAATIDATSLAIPVTIDANHQSRIFDIGGPGDSFDVTIAGLTLTGGKTLDPSEHGGAVRSQTTGILTIESATITGSRTTGLTAVGGGVATQGDVILKSSIVQGNWTEGLDSNGGGIFSNRDITLIETIIEGNYTLDNDSLGGGILATDVMLTDSTVRGNTTHGSNSNAGGIAASGNVTLIRSTVSGNETQGIGTLGGGIGSYGTVYLTESTISGNRSMGTGGGIAAAAVTADRSTVTNNEASGTGGGILSLAGPVNLSSSIVSDNTGAILTNEIDPGPSSVVASYSLLGLTVSPVSSVTNIFTNDPKLGPLGDNGGPTQTHALLPDSLALDAGDATATPGVGNVPLFDQRGNNYGRVQNGRIDIGAFEVRETPSADFDGDGFITGFDFLKWQRGYGTTAPNAVKTDGDADNDLDVDAADLVTWEQQYGMAAPLVAAVSSEQSEDEVTRSASLLVVEASTESLESLSMEAATKETANSASPAAVDRSDNDLLNTVRALQHGTRLLPKAHATEVREHAFVDVFASPREDYNWDLPTSSSGVHEISPFKSEDSESRTDIFWLADDLLEKVFG